MAFDVALRGASGFDVVLTAITPVNLLSSDDATIEATAGDWVASTGSTTVVRSTVGSREGTAALAILAAGTGNSAARLPTAFDATPVTAGVTYTVLVSAQGCVNNAGFQIQVPFWDSGGGSLGNLNNGWSSQLSNTQFRDFRFVFTAPAGATTAGLYVWHGDSPTTWWGIDRIGIFEGTIPTSAWVAPTSDTSVSAEVAAATGAVTDASTPTIATRVTSGSVAADTVLTFSHTAVGTMLVVDVGYAVVGAPVISVTFNGSNLTRLGYGDSGGGGSDRRIERWYLASPANVTANVVVTVTVSTSVAAVATSMTNVSTTTPFGTLVTNGGSGATSGSVTASGVFILGAVAVRTTTASTPGGSQTETASVLAGTNVYESTTKQTNNGASTWTWAVADVWAALANGVNSAASVYAGNATGTGTSNDATVALGASAGVAAGTGAADNAVGNVGATAEAATGTGVAQDATVTVVNMERLWVASDIALSDGAAVSSWVDRISATDLTQATPAARPTYQTAALNGQPAVYFDGGDSLASAAAAFANNGAAYTVVIAFRVPSSPVVADVTGTLFAAKDNADTETRFSVILNGANFGASIYQYDGTSRAQDITSPTQPQGAGAVIAFSVAAGAGTTQTSTNYINGAAATPATLAPWNTKRDTTGDATSLRVGAGGVGSYKGWIAEVHVYRTDLSAGDIAAISSALNATYGLYPGVAPGVQAVTATGAVDIGRAALGVSAGVAAGTGAAQDATVSLGATAGNATGSGTANSSTVALTVNAEVATGSGVAQNATASVGATTGNATGTGVSNDATVQTVTSTNADAGLASGTGTSDAATTAITVRAETAVPFGWKANGNAAWASDTIVRVIPNSGSQAGSMVATQPFVVDGAVVTVEIDASGLNADGYFVGFLPETSSIDTVGGTGGGYGKSGTGAHGVALNTYSGEHIKASDGTDATGATTSTTTKTSATWEFTFHQAAGVVSVDVVRNGSSIGTVTCPNAAAFTKGYVYVSAGSGGLWGAVDVRSLVVTHAGGTTPLLAATVRAWGPSQPILAGCATGRAVYDRVGLDVTDYWQYNGDAVFSSGIAYLTGTTPGTSRNGSVVSKDTRPDWIGRTITIDAALVDSADWIEFGVLDAASPATTLQSNGFDGATGFYGVRLDIYNDQVKPVSGGTAGSGTANSTLASAVLEPWSLVMTKPASQMHLALYRGATLVQEWDITAPSFSVYRIAVAARTGGVSGQFYFDALSVDGYLADPTPSIGASAGAATGTGAAYDVTATDPNVTVSAGLAAGTGAAYDAVSTVGPSAGSIDVTGAANQSTTAIAANAANASSTGAALDAIATVGPNAPPATGVGSADNAVASVSPAAGVAAGTGAALDATGTVGVSAGAAVGYASSINLATANQSSAETDTTGFYAFNGSTGRSTAQHSDGIASATLTVTTSSTASYIRAGNGSTSYLPVHEGEVLTVVIDGRPARTGDYAIYVQWYDSAGASVGGTVTVGPFALTAATWAQMTGEVTAPAGAARATVGYYVYAANSTSFDVHYTDRYGMWSGSGGAWALGGSAIVDAGPHPTGAVGASAECATGTGAALDATIDATSATNANADVATGTGTANNAVGAVGAAAESTAGTGAALDATITATASPTAEAATGTGAALDATITATASPTADVAAGSGAALDTTTALAPSAGVGAGTGSALDAVAALGVTTGIGTGAGTAYDATVTASGSATPECALGSVVVYDAAVQASDQQPAEEIAVTGAAFDATVTVGASPSTAAGTGAALDAVPAPSTSAEAATGTGAALDATVTATASPAAGVAAGAGVAYDATIAAAGSASAETATGSGAALDAVAALTPSAGVATGTGAAYDATVTATASPTATPATGTGAAFDAGTALTVNAGAATGTGTAADPVPAVAVSAEVAAASGAALDISTSATSTPTPECANATGEALDATITATASPSAEAATGTGSALAAVGAVGGSPSTGTGTGTGQDAGTALTVNADAALGAGAALDAAVSASASPTAVTATGTGTGLDASTTIGATAGAGSGTGTGQDAGTALTVNAEAALGSAAALDATVAASASPTASTATGSGSALDPVGAVGGATGSGSGTGSANDATIIVTTGSETATATGAALDATTTSVGFFYVYPDAATGSGAGLDTSVAVGAAGQTGSGSGVSGDGTPWVTVTADPAFTVGAGLDATVSRGLAVEAEATVTATGDADATLGIYPVTATGTVVATGTAEATRTPARAGAKPRTRAIPVGHGTRADEDGSHYTTALERGTDTERPTYTPTRGGGSTATRVTSPPV